MKNILSREDSVKYNVVPKSITNNYYKFYASSPSQIVIDDLEYIFKKKIQLEVVTSSELEIYRENLYEGSGEELSELLSVVNNIEIEDKSMDYLDLTTDSPLVTLFSKILNYAIDQNCSDIHFEGMQDYFRVRIRKDGILKESFTINKSIQANFISRIKIISGLDIAEKRLPQDGRFSYEVNKRNVNIRVATTPTIHGEKAVLRILDNSNIEYTLEGIGLENSNLNKVSRLIRQPNGLILVCGPTTSGKTSSIYAMLNMLNSEEINIMTIEDPVEYKLEGINQIQVNEKTGMDFNKGLKTILRTDPDIIMVGEIRDSETAKTAIRASITGHLVLSTIHTNDSPSAIIRLMDMGVEDYLVSAGLIGVISQRLIRILCNHCKKEVEVESSLLNGKAKVYESVGCPKCNNGYIGRKAVFEILIFDDDIRKSINNNSPLIEIKRLARAKGMVDLKEEIITLLLRGETSLSEAYKVISSL